MVLKLDFEALPRCNSSLMNEVNSRQRMTKVFKVEGRMIPLPLNFFLAHYYASAIQPY
jgi:hypothetical protein